MAQMPWMSSGCSVRLLVSPAGANAAMVAVWSVVWSRPMECPASCVTVFCTSMETQFTGGSDGSQGGLSAVVKVSLLPSIGFGESFSSMSLSKIWPVYGLEVVVVVAMTPVPLSQQSYLFGQVRSVVHGSPGGTALLQLAVRQSTRLRLSSPRKYPTRRSPCSSGSTSGKTRSEQVTAPQVVKLLRTASKAEVPGTSGVPRESIWKLCPRGPQKR